MTRPPMIHLAGNTVSCCGGWILIDCDGIYKCPCGKRQEARAMKIVKAMGLDDVAADAAGKDGASHEHRT